MGYHKRHVVLATGTKVSATHGAPTVEDLAISLTRLPRFAANGILWFPVGNHCFVVYDLLPWRLKVYGLTHDGAETVGNDVPKPMKPAIVERRENKVTTRMWQAMGLAPLSVEDAAIVKAADTEALYGEIFTAGPVHLRPEYANVKRSPRAERLVMHYYHKFTPEICVQYNGPAAQEFIKRFNASLRFLRLLVAPASIAAPSTTHANK
jgi:hypothetical protein